MGQTLLLQGLPFVPPDMNAVYSRGVSANIDLSVAARSTPARANSASSFSLFTFASIHHAV